MIVGGGPGCVSDDPAEINEVEAQIEAAVLGMMPQICDQDIPFMGCCYGIGVLGHYLGAEVNKNRYFEAIGPTDCQITKQGQGDAMLAGLPQNFVAFVGHKEALQELPKGCTHLLSSPTCPYQMIRFGENVYATQFHPEADSHVFELRIGVYKNYGYFKPEDAKQLIEMCHNSDVHMTEFILRSFVRKYQRD